jgi:hypothetical protein
VHGGGRRNPDEAHECVSLIQVTGG